MRSCLPDRVQLRLSRPVEFESRKSSGVPAREFVAGSEAYRSRALSSASVNCVPEVSRVTPKNMLPRVFEKQRQAASHNLLQRMRKRLAQA